VADCILATSQVNRFNLEKEIANVLLSNSRARAVSMPGLVIAALALLCMGQSSPAQVGSPPLTTSLSASSPKVLSFLVIGEATANNTRTGAVAPIRQDPSIGPMRPLPVPADPKLPTLFLIGDSTVRNGKGDGANGQWGWGDFMAGYFDTSRINVVNRALGGLSSRTYLTLGYWDALLAMLKPGDVVIMQFGHNDSGPVNDNYRARGSIKGTGEESMEIDNLILKRHEVVYSYGWYLRKFIADTEAKGATPIVCSLVPRKIWKDDSIATNSQDYAKWAAEVADRAKVGFVDLNAIIARKYEELGPEKVEPLFADAQTHTTLAGAEINAASVVAGLKALKKNPLARYFSVKAKEVEKAKREKPRSLRSA
jgi:lysophospholipase L1-like esterase